MELLPMSLRGSIYRRFTGYVWARGPGARGFSTGGSLRGCAFTGGGCALYTAVCECGFAALTILVSW